MNINDLISRAAIYDEGLARDIQRFVGNRQFGLVYEESKPEFVRLYNKPVVVGDTVNILPPRGVMENMSNDADEHEVKWHVVSIKDNTAHLECLESGEEKDASLDDLVTYVRFDQPIYAGLKEVDRIERGGDKPYHVVINGENFHALESLMFAYQGKVDCIYIDPPYNTGAKDWKYNNNYVSGEDIYRHSKWLTFMEDRLRLAKKLLNPKTGVLICTIDEHEVHRLRCLIEQLFSECFIQMVTIVINKKGVAQHRFARVEEYAIYAFMPDATVPTNFDDLLGENNTTETFNEVVRWERLLRGGNNSRREDRPKMFYPVYIDPQKKVITGIGDILPLDQQPDLTNIDSKTIAWPIRSDQSLGHWQLQPSTFLELLKKGFVKVGTWDKKRKTWTILYLNNGTRKRINDGDIVITGRDELTNVVNVEFARPEAKMYAIKTVWNRKSHDSGVYGSTLLRNIIGRDRKFDFPKSVYSTKDAIQSILRNRPEALIVDFFAGSGTTQHAIDLINAEDGGTRNCICITNNEISVDEIKGFVKKNIRQGDPEWEAHGIAHYVTWPRTSCCINGVDVNGKPLSGSYIGSERPMSDGFEENAIFFDLEYLEPSVVQANMAFNEIAPLLWIKAGSKGRIIQHCDKYDISDNYAVLFDYRYIGAFTREVQKMPDVKTIFIVTDHDARYRDMCAAFPDRDVTQLYEDYLRSFEISSEG